jgi:hypothetical protein
MRTDAASAARRFGDLILRDHKCLDVFGLIRRDVLLDTSLIASYPGSDRVLLAELALRGPFRLLPEPLLLSRDHPERSINALPALHLRAAWFAPDVPPPRFPNWRLWREYARALRRAPLPAAERLRCWGSWLRWPAANLNWARMGRDPLIAAGVDWRRLTRPSPPP